MENKQILYIQPVIENIMYVIIDKYNSFPQSVNNECISIPPVVVSYHFSICDFLAHFLVVYILYIELIKYYVFQLLAQNIVNMTIYQLTFVLFDSQFINTVLSILHLLKPCKISQRTRTCTLAILFFEICHYGIK